MVVDGALVTETETVAVRRIPGVTRNEALAGVAVFVMLALVGALVRSVELFGALPKHGRYPLPGSALMNGVTLALAPFVGVLWAYRRVRRVPAAPYGIHGRGPVGGRKTVFVVGSFAAISGLIFGDRGRALEGAEVAGFMAVVLAILIEGQRRRRDWLGPDEWTDSRIDQLTVQVEVLVLGAAAAVVALIVAWTDPSVAADERINFGLVPVAAAMFVGWSGAVGAMSTTPAVDRVVSPPVVVSWIWLVFWFATAVLAVWSNVAPTLVGLWAVVGGGLLTLVAERARRQARAQRLAELVATVGSDRLSERYGGVGRA